MEGAAQTIYAPGLNGGEKRPIRECKRCGRDIVWVKSKRTGRYYPANVFRTGKYEARKYAPWDPHRCGKEQA